MSRRNRGNAGTTYVNNVRGPTSALTSFLNERGIRRANPAPAPPVTTPPENQDDNEEDDDDEPATPPNHATASSSSSSTPAPVSSSRPTRTARLIRGRNLPARSTRVSQSNEADGVDDASDSSDSDDDGDDSDSDSKNLIPIAISASTARAVRATRSRTSTVAASSSSSNAVASSSNASSSTAKAKAAASKKRPRKKDASDDSDDEDFHDITGHISRSNFSHKGRMPQGSNKIVFCSRCRARFTIKAGTTPAVDEDDGGLLCPTCAGTGSPGPSKNALPKAKPVKRARRKAQKAEIECHIPSLQDLCIQVMILAACAYLCAIVKV